jgi:ABC-type transporter MlaC component
MNKLFWIIGLFTLVSTQAFAEITPEEVIKDIFSRAGKENLLNNPKSKDEVEAHVDFGEMTKAILKEEASNRNLSDMKWFETTIKEIITRSVYPSAPKFLENVKFTFKKTQNVGELVKVASSINKKGESTSVDYLLKKVGNEWKVVDVAIDDESWVKTINEKVHKTLKDKGWDGLKDLLNKRLKELKSKKVASKSSESKAE